MSNPTEQEINACLNWCLDAEDTGTTNYHGMTYEQGVRDAIDWLQGNGSDPSNE